MFLSAFAYYDSEVVEASFESLAHVGDMGEEEEARAKEGSPQQKTFEAVGKSESKETTHTSKHTLGGHCHAGSSFDEFCVYLTCTYSLCKLTQRTTRWRKVF